MRRVRAARAAAVRDRPGTSREPGQDRRLRSLHVCVEGGGGGGKARPADREAESFATALGIPCGSVSRLQAARILSAWRAGC